MGVYAAVWVIFVTVVRTQRARDISARQTIGCELCRRSHSDAVGQFTATGMVVGRHAQQVQRRYDDDGHLPSPAPQVLHKLARD